MGEIGSPSHVLLLLAAFSRYQPALDWARGQGEKTWGPVALESPAFEFTQTDYYQPTMGPGLRKIFWLFENRWDPSGLPDVKILTNRWEEEYAATAGLAEPRPLNLDPGYLSLAKLVLASTKDHSHRIYLRQGIYAEITLSYSQQRWQARPWTFADYRREDYQQFFLRGRTYLHQRIRQEPKPCAG
jgi:hypothetical protein